MGARGVASHSPLLTCVPSESVIGFKALRRVLTIKGFQVLVDRYPVQGYIPLSRGFMRADSFRKLSKRGRPRPVVSHFVYDELSVSFLSGSRYSGCVHKSRRAKVVAWSVH
jgi:hypothetical protein